ncbi:MAG: twin-arginine translocase subunit TatC [Casimicrobiaceae bacterium]|nr:twin-arginine translocase subunit TatC [Casimicrobiaceae bacterium]MDW8312599.1 twin-arginine translocase subunit TatC [Burkholderiales bacterium]
MSNEPETLKEESFISHLVELRDRLIRAIAAVFIVLIVLLIYPGQKAIYSFVAAPLMKSLPQGGSMIVTDVIGVFFIPLKVTLLVSFLLALPFVLYQVWAFVAPGLYKHEKQLALPLIVSSTVLFFVGMAFAYFVVFPFLFPMLFGYAPDGVTVATDIEKYWSFALTMFLAFGVTFETPVVLGVLVRAGIATVEQLKAFRSYFIVGAFVIAAIVTPPDVLSQLFLAIPLVILYELGIWMCKLIKPRAPTEA